MGRLIEAGHWHQGDLRTLVVFDAGYDVTRLTWLLADLPVELPGRLRSDRVMHCPAPPLPARPASTGGRRPRHGPKLAPGGPATWPEPDAVTRTAASRYGTAEATARGRTHQRLAHRDAWAGHEGELPVIEGTLTRLQADRLPGQRDAEPAWPWSPRAGSKDSPCQPRPTRSWRCTPRRTCSPRRYQCWSSSPGPRSPSPPPPSSSPADPHKTAGAGKPVTELRDPGGRRASTAV